jgi:methylated-DNA-[protein]-cysteine S-methyltransferase
MKAAATEFTQRVLSVVRRIPVGRVATYGGVAALAGRRGAARAVGTVMKNCGRPDVPCHRVIAAGGKLGGYGGSEGLKRALLLAEGITMRGSTIPLKKYEWPSRGQERSIIAGKKFGSSLRRRRK